jgi:adenylosuccinate synthase
MQTVKVVIGANYGDEGKGLAVDYFCQPGQSNVGVLTNGTAQRGHTVTLSDGRTHVFHHFSSGTFQGATTYIGEEFIVNPIVFVQEYEELVNKFNIVPVVYVHPNCKVATPYDMLANLLERRKRGVHDTCGLGFWKTVERYRKGISACTLKELRSLLDYGTPFKDGNQVPRFYFDAQDRTLNNILGAAKDYHKDILKNATLDIDFAGLAGHFKEDLMFLFNHTICADYGVLLNYQNVIFESGQGLLIGNQKTNGEANWDFCTPSDTGVGPALDIIEKNFFPWRDIEVCYVSRTYLTRHGDGPLDNECPREKVDRVAIDGTNFTNENQGALRYGILNGGLLKERIQRDFNRTRLARRTYFPSVMFTHCNEHPAFIGIFDDMQQYYSYSKVREGVKKWL